MKDWQSQAHVKWECKYHIVIVPKYRKKVMYKNLRHEVGKIMQQLCRQKGIELLEGHAMSDHVHLLLSVAPKHSIAMTIGYLKGKSAIRINRDYQRVKGTLFGIMNSDGSEQKNLTNNPADDLLPAWSPFLRTVHPDSRFSERH